MKEIIIEFLNSKYEIGNIGWRYIFLPEHEYCLSFTTIKNGIEQEYASLCTVFNNRRFTVSDWIGNDTDLTNEFIKYKRYKTLKRLI